MSADDRKPTPTTDPPITDSWPLPTAPSIDHALQDLTEHAGYEINEDDFITVFADRPHLVMAWASAAAQYTAIDYQIQLLHPPIDWMREAITPQAGGDLDEISQFVGNLGRLFGEYNRLKAAHADAWRSFTRTCQPLKAEGLLYPLDRKWHRRLLIAHPLTDPAPVQVPQDAQAPWPLVKAAPMLLFQLSRARALPVPGIPVIRESSGRFARVDHHGTWQRLLPDPDGWYWLRGCAWTEPPPADTPPAAAVSANPPITGTPGNAEGQASTP